MDNDAIHLTRTTMDIHPANNPGATSCGQVTAGVGKVQKAVSGVAMLRKAFKTALVANHLQGMRISFLLLFTGGATPSRPCNSS